MSRGVIEFLQFAGSVVFAVPVGFFGLLKLAEGDVLVGAGFLFLSAVMVLGREYITSPKDLPAMALQRVTGRVVKDPDEEE
ncbi:MAG: hypothetical protein V5A45_10380 [Haloarculaceae archaeon]